MKKKGFTKAIMGCLIAALFVTFVSVGVRDKSSKAAVLGDINASSVFLKQPSGSSTCTLYAACMMMRRAALLNNDLLWNYITPDAIESTAWLSGTGLRWDFTYSGIRVKHDNFDGKESTLKTLLASHAEGIVIYKKTSAQCHAILITDYSDGTFYCADPAPGTTSGRIAVSKASIKIADARYIWYVADGSSSQSVLATATPTAKPTSIPKTITKETAKATTTVPTKVEKVTGLKSYNSKGKKIKASWSKVKEADGYQLIASKTKTFKSKKTVITTKTSAKTAKLTKGRTYYVKARAYVVEDEKTIYGKYSAKSKVYIYK